MTVESEPTPEVVLISFDVDGTMEDGDPPGPIGLSVLQRVMALGYVVGSSSDRTFRDQRELWQKRGIEPAFVSHKHQLPDIAKQFSAQRKIHIGDTDIDMHYAHVAGYEFVRALELPEAGTPGWIY